MKKEEIGGVLFNSVITTANKYTIDDCKDSLIISPEEAQGAVKMKQTVLFVGSQVDPNIKPGMEVELNPNKYIRNKQVRKSVIDNSENYETQYYFVPPIMNVGGEDYLYISDSDIKFWYKQGE